MKTNSCSRLFVLLASMSETIWAIAVGQLAGLALS